MKKKKKIGPKVIWEEWEQEGILQDKLILIEGWAREGAINTEIAHNLGISETTFYDYQATYPEFKQAVRRGKEVVDYMVERALLNQALGGNITAQIFWLKNRKPADWLEINHIDASLMIDSPRLIYDIPSFKDDNGNDE